MWMQGNIQKSSKGIENLLANAASENFQDKVDEVVIMITVVLLCLFVLVIISTSRAPVRSRVCFVDQSSSIFV